jgi:hypothetical protein
LRVIEISVPVSSDPNDRLCRNDETRLSPESENPIRRCYMSCAGNPKEPLSVRITYCRP